MNDQFPLWRSLYSLVGIQVIPSEDIPNGFRHTVGDTIFVSPQNYEYMRPLSAKETIIMLGFLAEMVPKESPNE